MTDSCLYSERSLGMPQEVRVEPQRDVKKEQKLHSDNKCWLQNVLPAWEVKEPSLNPRHTTLDKSLSPSRVQLAPHQKPKDDH